MAPQLPFVWVKSMQAVSFVISNDATSAKPSSLKSATTNSPAPSQIEDQVIAENPFADDQSNVPTAGLTVPLAHV